MWICFRYLVSINSFSQCSFCWIHAVVFRSLKIQWIFLSQKMLLIRINNFQCCWKEGLSINWCILSLNCRCSLPTYKRVRILFHTLVGNIYQFLKAVWVSQCAFTKKCWSRDLKKNASSRWNIWKNKKLAHFPCAKIKIFY